MTIVKSKYRGTKEYERVYAGLIAAAKSRGIFTYAEISQILGITRSGKYMSNQLNKILSEISEDEVSAGRPMLSAIATGVKKFPGPGFFALAKELGRMAAGEDEGEFWKRECQAVYDAWKA
jgi:hypothetical protein